MERVENMSWDFAKTEDMTVNGANLQAFETMKGAIIREIIQNSLDAKRAECDKVILEVELSKKRTIDFPGLENLKDTLKACIKQYENSDKKSTEKLKEMLNNLEKEEHYLVTFRDLNTKGLEGGLSREDQATNLFQLVYGEGTTNKNTNKTSGGSFGIGKNAPFTKSAINTVFYETYNTKNESYLVGKSILASHVINGDMHSQRGYYIDDGEIKDYIADLGMNKQYGTAVHVPFYNIDDDGIQDEALLLICDVLLNFMIAIKREKLEVKFINNDTTQRLCVDSNTYPNILDKIIDEQIKPEIVNMLKAMKNLLINPEVKEEKIEVFEGDSENYIELFVALNGESTNYKKYFNFREQLMLIDSKKIRNKNYKYDALAIYHGTKINNILRDAEPPEHNKWEKSRLKSEQKKVFTEIIKKVENKITGMFSEVNTDKIVLKEFNNNIFSKEKEREDVYTIKGLSEKSNINSKGNSTEVAKAEISRSDKKLKTTQTGADRGTFNNEGEFETSVVKYVNVAEKIRFRNNGEYHVKLKEGYFPQKEDIKVFSKTDTGKEEKITNFEVLENNGSTMKIKVEDVDLDINVVIEESNENKK